MKLLLIIVMTVLFYCNVSAQLIGTYYMDLPNKIISCRLVFLKDGRYLLLLKEQVTNDQNEIMIFSDGRAIQKNNEITLIDRVLGYKMVMIKNNNLLKVINSFSWLKNKNFVFSDGSGSDSESTLRMIERFSGSISSKRIEYKRTHKNIINFFPGVYEDVRSPTSLNVRSDKQYILTYKNIILSEGMWKRQGNEILLFDVATKFFFYMLIDDNALISCLLPGEYAYRAFYKSYKNGMQNGI